MQPNPQVQYSEQALSQVSQQSVEPNPQSGFLLDLRSQLALPTQPVNPVPETPVAPMDSTQHNVLVGHLYHQQQYLIGPNVGPGTIKANRPSDAPTSEQVSVVPVIQQVVLPPLVNQPPPVPDPPPAMQQNQGGVAQTLLHMPPVYCPQSCPPGSSNCCFQLAFHQHYHHILPGGPANTPFIYTGLPSLTQVASQPGPPHSPPAGDGAYSQPPEGSVDTRTALPLSTPLIADSSRLYWLSASQRPHRIQTTHLRQTPRYQDAHVLTRSHWPNTAPPPNYQGPSEATRSQRLDRLRYIVNPNLSSSQSPQKPFPTGPGHTSHAYVVQRSPPSQYFQQVVQDVQRNEPVNHGQHHSGQHTIALHDLSKGLKAMDSAALNMVRN